MPFLLEDLKAMKVTPSAIVYDPFLAQAQVAAHVLGIPAVSTCTMPGPGAIDYPDAVKEAWDAKPWVLGPARNMLGAYGFDVLKTGSHGEFYSSTLNLVTTIDELFLAPKPGRQRQMFGNHPFRCVGVLKEQSVRRVANSFVKQGSENASDDALLLQTMDEASRAGRRLLFVSMGTVATGPRWSTRIGAAGAANGLADCTGKELVQHVFRCCFEALRENTDFLVVMSTGPQGDALDRLPPVPSNFIVRQAVPQLDVLQRCSAFLTHGGANSMHEALSFGVPMVVVPVFADQPMNCDTVVRCGAGLGFRLPLTSVSSDALRSAFSEVTAEGNSFRAGAEVMSKKILDAGGSEAAADAIMDVMRSSASMGTFGGA